MTAVFAFFLLLPTAALLFHALFALTVLLLLRGVSLFIRRVVLLKLRTLFFVRTPPALRLTATAALAAALALATLAIPVLTLAATLWRLFARTAALTLVAVTTPSGLGSNRLAVGAAYTSYHSL